MQQHATRTPPGLVRHGIVARRLALVALLSSGCGPTSRDAVAPDTDVDPGQMRELCEAERRSGAFALFPYSAKGEAIEAWLSSRLTHEATRTLYYETLMQSPVHHQEAILRDAAADVGVEPCPMAAYLGFLAGMSLQATSYENCVTACISRNGDLSRATYDCDTGCGGKLGD